MKIVKKSNVIESDDEDEENVHSAQPLVELRRKTRKILFFLVFCEIRSTLSSWSSVGCEKENDSTSYIKWQWWKW